MSSDEFSPESHIPTARSVDPWDQQAWHEYQLSFGPGYWEDCARAGDMLAQQYAERSYEQPDDPGLAQWSMIYSGVAANARELAAEAAARLTP